MSRAGPRDPHCLVLKGTREDSVDFIEPSQSFQSMRSPGGKGSPPVAATHRHHIQKLEMFLEIVPRHEQLLEREVLRRRKEVVNRRAKTDPAPELPSNSDECQLVRHAD